MARRRRINFGPALQAAWWVTRRLGRVAWRYRAGLTPAWIAVVVALSGWLLRGHAPDWWRLPILVATVAAPVVFWGGSRMSGPAYKVWGWLVPDALDKGVKGVLDRATERGYLALLVLGSGSWVSWIGSHEWTDTTRRVFYASIVVAGVPWWWHRGFRRRKRPNWWAVKWANVRDAGGNLKGFEDSRVIGHTGDRAVTELRVRLRGGMTVNQVGDLALPVASALSPRLRPGAVTLSQGTAARDVLVRIVPKDPWTGTILHPMPPIGSVNLDANGKVFIGRLEDKMPLLHKMRQHTMIVAQSGSGKSIMLDTLLAWMVISRSAILGIDMASGVSLGEWQPVLSAPLATNHAEAKELLRGIMNIVEWRERKMKQLRVKEWPYGDVFVPIDEFPSLVRAGGKEVVSTLTILAERARKTRVWFYLAAQNGTKEDLGSTELRAQMMTVLGGRLDSHMNKILWAELTKTGWDGTALQVGTWLLRDATRNQPRVAKGALTPDGARERLIRAAEKANEGRLDKGSMGALCGQPVVLDAAEARPSLLGGTAAALDAVHQPSRAPLLPSSPAPLNDLDESVYAELPDDGQGGVGSTPIAKQLGVSRDRVERSLRRMQSDGRVRHRGGLDGWCRSDS